MNSTPKNLVSLQYLRAAAALVVVCFHAQIMIPGFSAIFPATFGNCGVDLFFVISGFVMVYVTSTRLRTPSEFITARLIRIVPLYWVVTIGCGTLLYIAPNLFSGSERSFRHFILSLLFIPHAATVGNFPIEPLVKAGWTLLYEMYFYVVFTLAMVISTRYRIVVAGAFMTAIVVANVLLRQSGALPADAALSFYSNFFGSKIVLEFLFGAVVAQLYCNQKSSISLSRVKGIAIVLLSTALLVSVEYIVGRERLGSGDRFVYYGAPAAVIVMTVLQMERNNHIGSSRFLLLVGDASYSIYLIHMFPLAILRWAWPKLSLPTEGLFWALAFVFTSFVAVIPCGILSYKLVELPSMRLMRAFFSVDRKPASDRLVQDLRSADVP